MPQAGSRRTPNVALFFYHKGNYRPMAGPIIRMISDMADDQKILAILDTGTEMRAGSPHIDDQMKLFHAGQYVEMPTPYNLARWPSAATDKASTLIVEIKPVGTEQQRMQQAAVDL